jgi:maltose alpha-D-glucosyltransferase/alpha-amylase
MNWTKRLLAVRSSHAFGRGRFTLLHPGNRKVLAYLREHDDDVILCVFNLSRVGAAGGTRPRIQGTRARGDAGPHPFPPIGTSALPADLPAYGFFWFRLATDAAPPDLACTRSLPIEDLPVLVLFDGWNSFFRDRFVPWRIGMAEKTRNRFERELLPRFMLRQRWYAAKAEPLERATFAAHGLLAVRLLPVAAGPGRCRRAGRTGALFRAAGDRLRGRR